MCHQLYSQLRRSLWQQSSTLGLTCLLFMASPTLAYATQTEGVVTRTYSADDEALYLRRFNQFIGDGSGVQSLAKYDPMEIVEGASDTSPLPLKAASSLSDQALTLADNYVKARNSSTFIVWKNGVIEYERYYAGAGRETPIISKSMAKPVTALLVGRALMDGHIRSLDQPVADFITEWKGDAKREKMLVRHLLDMRTGFLPQSIAQTADNILNRAYLHPRHDEILIHDYPLTDEPGSVYEYSNATSELIAPLIERATGQRYSDYLSEALLKPLGAAGGSLWVNREAGMAHSGCCLMLPAQSWLRMAMLIMADGIWQGERLLPENYVAEMRNGTPQNPHYGLGLWLAGPYLERRGFGRPGRNFGRVLHSEPYADKDLFLFDGNSNQVIYMIPSQNMIILRTGETPPRALEWDNALLPNLLIRDSYKNSNAPAPPAQSR